ncbi:hypothetical protein OG350_34330 [Streptomyces achromogenes]|uniref:Uncharacterized protein n=1 Tax=Streptomyces achromogenes TaxID=67255 RepID=A0ABZ1L088_STRAH
MLAMVGHPGDERALHGEAAGRRAGDPQRPSGLERAVGQVPVEAGRDAGPADQVEGHGEREADGARPVPSGRQGEERHGDEDADHRLLAGGPGRAAADGVVSEISED